MHYKYGNKKYMEKENEVLTTLYVSVFFCFFFSVENVHPVWLVGSVRGNKLYGLYLCLCLCFDGLID